MMHIYSALLFIAIHPKRFTIMCGGGGVFPEPPPVCSIHLDDTHTSFRWRGERIIEPINVYAHHTPATGEEERES